MGSMTTIKLWSLGADGVAVHCVGKCEESKWWLAAAVVAIRDAGQSCGCIVQREGPVRSHADSLQFLCRKP